VIDALLAGALACYGLASAVLLSYLVGRGSRPAPAGVALLWLALLLQLVHDAARWALLHVGPFDGIAPAMSGVGVLVVAAFLLVRRLRPRVSVVGAFVAPVALVLLVASRALAADPVGGGAMLALHIGSNMVGLAAFTVACAMAVAYLLQEHQVKTRRLGGLFHRLPPLQVLDDLAYRCIAIGLPALTLGVVTGHVVAARGRHAPGLPWQQYFAMVSWALFAAVLFLRLLAGWRGRRAAIGTILGYVSSVLVLLFYSVRGAA
jgi:ABC-type uncharacterized transport system permease subunit